MTARRTLLLLVACGVPLAGTAAGVIAWRGSSAGTLRGVALGLVLGAGGLFLESVLVARALRRPGVGAILVFLGGFAVRLALVLGATLLFKATGLADPAAFALCFLAGFLAALPVLGVAAAGEARA